MEGDRERERDREGVPAESGTPEAFAQLWADVMGILVSAAPAGGLPRAAPSPKPAGGGGDGGIVRRRRPPHPRQRGDGGCWGGMGATAGSCCLGGEAKKNKYPQISPCACAAAGTGCLNSERRGWVRALTRCSGGASNRHGEKTFMGRGCGG